MSICCTLSERGNPMDYRPAAQHYLFKQDGLFDFRYGAVRHCYNAVDRYARQQCWVVNKVLYTGIMDGAAIASSSDKIDLVLIATGLSDADRGVLVDIIHQKLRDATSGLAARVTCNRGDTSTDFLRKLADALSMQALDRHSLFRNKGPPSSAIGQDTIWETPMKAIASHLSSADSSELLVMLDHCEKLDIQTLDNIIVQLATAKLPGKVRVIAFCDLLCQLPVQLSPTAQAHMQTRTLVTASPWELYESVCGRLYSARDIPLTFSSSLVSAMRLAFEESELCVTSALRRFKLCLAEHFEERRSLLTMYRETGWLQQMSIMSKSEAQFKVPSAPSKVVRTATGESQLRRSSTSDSLAASVGGGSTLIGDDGGDDNDDGTIVSEGVSSVARSSAVGEAEICGRVPPMVTSASAKAAAGQANDGDKALKRMQHRLGISAILGLLKTTDLEGTGLSLSDESIHQALEAFELRNKVNYVWYFCLKVMRDLLLPVEDRPSFGSDLLWTDLHQMSLRSTASPSSSTALLEGGRACAKLLHAVRQALPKVPGSTLREAVAQLHEFLQAHTGDVAAEECTAYAAFLSDLVKGVGEVEDTIGYFEEEAADSPCLTMHMSLLRMKAVVQKQGAKETVQVSLGGRIGDVLEGDDADQQTRQAVEDGPAAPIAEATRVVELGKVTIFSEILSDFIAWVTTSSQRYAALPLPSSLCGGSASTVTEVNLKAILQASAAAEARALAGMDDNLHANFVAPWRDPDSLFPSTTAPSATVFSHNQGQKNSATNGRITSVGASSTAPASTGPKFRPDGAVLHRLMKTCQQRDTADAWFQDFAAAVKHYPAWEIHDLPAAVTGKKRKSKRVPLDERTVLKARFASALHEMEVSGLIKCTTSGNTPGSTTVVVERKIYTWV